MLFIGPATDIFCCTDGYPTEDSNGSRPETEMRLLIPRAFAGSWKAYGSSKKRLPAKASKAAAGYKCCSKLFALDANFGVVRYSQNQKEALCAFLGHWNVPLPNNLA